MSRPSVWVVENNYSVQELFSHEGFEVLYNESSVAKNGVDLICFTGGEDVSPTYYNEERHHKTHCHPTRDVREMLTYERFLDTPKVGICRGGQLLNVLSGGKLFQDVDGHRRHHKVIDLLFTKKELLVPSGHHQMMIPPEGSAVLAVAFESTVCLSCAKPPHPKLKYDPEVVWIPKTSSLCYQSHPEWRLEDDKEGLHKDYFFSLLNWAFRLKGVHEN